ncbi:MAG: hypothetical protein KJ023_13155 [Burkholderiaceae bacterium]|nr:hypothetical protein [Burkholderiaceae bacterium]
MAFQRAVVSSAWLRTELPLPPRASTLLPPMSNTPRGSGTRKSGLTLALLLVTTKGLSSLPPSPPPASARPKQVSSKRFSPNSSPRSSGERATSRSYSSRSVSSHTSRKCL